MDSERARYLKTIEDAFVALRGRGFMLSPRDVALVDAWRARGIPDRLVVRALTDGARRFKRTHPAGSPLPGTLAYFASQIEQVASLRRERTLGYDDQDRAELAEGEGDGEADESRVEPGAEDVVARVLAAIVQAGKAQEEEGPRAVLRGSYRAVKSGAGGDLWSVVREVDAVMVEGLLAGLDAGERAELEAAARVEVGSGRSMGVQARAKRERAALERRVRERFAVPDLVEVALR